MENRSLSDRRNVFRSTSAIIQHFPKSVNLSNDFFLPISETYHSIIFSYIKIARKSKKALDRTGMMCYNNIRCLQHHEILDQLAEHTPFKRRVEGSNPSYLTKKSVSWFMIRIFCCMRQSYKKSACRIFMRLS